MTVFEAIILGLVQGLTEFLPISSSGHMLLVGRFLGVGTLGLGFELICHVATLAAICAVMRKDVWELIGKPLSKPMRMIVVATVPTAVIAGLISVFCRDLLDGTALVYCFIVTGILLLCCGFAPERAPYKPMKYRHAALIGAVQGIAAFPGLSRSGTTIATCTMLGYGKEQSARFSFLLSVPVIIGSTAVELIFGGGVGGDAGVAALAAAAVAAFVSGLAAVKFMLKFLSKHGMDGFAVYLFLLSVFMLINDYALHLF